MTTLNGYTLSDHAILDGLETAAMAATSVTHTLGGSAVVQYDPMDIDTGIELRLIFNRTLRLPDVQYIRSLKGLQVTLEHHRGTYNVIVTNTDVEQDEPTTKADPKPTTWYSGEITMITV